MLISGQHQFQVSNISVSFQLSVFSSQFSALSFQLSVFSSQFSALSFPDLSFRLSDFRFKFQISSFRFRLSAFRFKFQGSSFKSQRVVTPKRASTVLSAQSGTPKESCWPFTAERARVVLSVQPRSGARIKPTA
jgi:hypothetical protein